MKKAELYRDDTNNRIQGSAGALPRSSIVGNWGAAGSSPPSSGCARRLSSVTH
jgi:hypothetical protein